MKPIAPGTWPLPEELAQFSATETFTCSINS